MGNLLGHSPEALVGADLREFIHPDDRQLVLDHREAALTAQRVPPPALFRLRRADGSWTWVRERLAVERADDGRPHRLVSE